MLHSYPIPIPSNISVPTWAYINVSVRKYHFVRAPFFYPLDLLHQVSEVWDMAAALSNHSAGTQSLMLN
jgi:hypothetical protein